MFRFLLLLLVMAGVGGYFTKPTEAQHREAVNAMLEQAQDAAASDLDLGGLVESSVTRFTQDGAYTDYYVASRYAVQAGDRPVADCWGAFTQVRCTPAVGASETPDAS
jgi:hypothetical protein